MYESLLKDDNYYSAMAAARLGRPVAPNPQPLPADTALLAGLEEMPRGVAVYSIDGPFFFGSVDSLERALSWSREPPRALVLRLDRVPFVDATGLKRLESTMAAMGRRGVRVLLTGANQRVLRKLVHAGIVTREGDTNYFGELSRALEWLQREDG